MHCVREADAPVSRAGARTGSDWITHRLLNRWVRDWHCKGMYRERGGVAGVVIKLKSRGILAGIRVLVAEWGRWRTFWSPRGTDWEEKLRRQMAGKVCEELNFRAFWGGIIIMDLGVIEQITESQLLQLHKCPRGTVWTGELASFGRLSLFEFLATEDFAGLDLSEVQLTKLRNYPWPAIFDSRP